MLKKLCSPASSAVLESIIPCRSGWTSAHFRKTSGSLRPVSHSQGVQNQLSCLQSPMPSFMSVLIKMASESAE